MLAKLQSIHRRALVSQAVHGNPMVKAAIASAMFRGAGRLGMAAMRRPMLTTGVAFSGMGVHQAAKGGVSKARGAYGARPRGVSVPYGHEGGMF